MATYPEDPIPNYPLVVSPRFKTLIRTAESGIEQRTYKQLYPQYDVVVKYSDLLAADIQTLWDFYIARKGAYEAFFIYDLALLGGNAFNHISEYVGVGDDAEDVFDIPGRSVASETVYVNGISKSDPGDYSISVQGGADPDQIDFVVAPPEGDVITIDFTGFLRMRVRFEEDSIPRQLFAYNAYKIGINLRGLPAL